MEEMLNEAEIDPDKYIIIESDNGSSQYKSAPHFHYLQEICNKYKSKIICVCTGVNTERKSTHQL